MSRRLRSIRPLDAAALERLALRYVERFATTRGKLVDYLTRKVRERGWEGPALDPADVAERFASLGYVDDRAYAEAKAASMTRRGLGARRVSAALRQARVADDDAAQIEPTMQENALESALVFARRRKLGPFGDGPFDRAIREWQIAAMLRAGHSLDLARKIVDAEDSLSLTEGE